VAESLGYVEARARVLAAVSPLAATVVPLGEARARPLRKSVRATHALPPFRNSSMDGFAVRAGDLAIASPATPVTLPVVEVLPAGRAPSRPLAAGEAMRIMTGAMVPEGADAIVPFEECERIAGAAGAERARFTKPAAANANVREAGRDIARDELALEDGRELSPLDLAVLAALGESQVSVGPRPKVTVFSTGDELLDAGAALTPGAIRDSNLPMLVALLEEAGCSVVRATRLGDDPAKLVEQIQRALVVSDVVLTIGGVSAGDFDPVKVALDGIPGVQLWRVAMKPGKPQAFGAPDGRLFFGLPGNPASVACVFETLVRPALRKLQGYAVLDRSMIEVRVAERIESREGRTDFVRVTLEWRDGAWWGTPTGEQVSGHLLPQARAHALLVVPAAAAALERNGVAEALIWRLPERAASTA
jgi:molybdopterin molybdotransferase